MQRNTALINISFWFSLWSSAHYSKQKRTVQKATAKKFRLINTYSIYWIASNFFYWKRLQKNSMNGSLANISKTLCPCRFWTQRFYFIFMTKLYKSYHLYLFSSTNIIGIMWPAAIYGKFFGEFWTEKRNNTLPYVFGKK